MNAELRLSTRARYDFTFRFAHKFLQRGDRTIDQMIQSARSGRKSMLEGGFSGRIFGAKVCDHSRPTNTVFIVGREWLSLRNLPAGMPHETLAECRQGQHRNLSSATLASAGKRMEQAA